MEDSLSFAEELSNEGAHPEDGGDIDGYFEELGTLAGRRIVCFAFQLGWQ